MMMQERKKPIEKAANKILKTNFIGNAEYKDYSKLKE